MRENKSEFAPQLHPDRSASSSPGGYVSAKSPPVGTAFIPTPVTKETPGPADDVPEEEVVRRVLDEQADEVLPDPSNPAWKLAWAVLKQRGVSAPRSERKFLDFLRSNETARMILFSAKPKLSEELGFADIEPPEALFELDITNPKPSAQLGRALLDLNMDIEDMIAFVPSRADTIKLSIKAWEKQQEMVMRERIDELRLMNAASRERDLQARLAAGAPGPRAREVERKAAEKRLIAEARRSGALR